MKRFAVVGLAACWAPEPVAAPISNTTPVASTSSQAVAVAWSTPDVTQGCFFFSGPFELGRDHHLGAMATVRTAGPNVSVDFGAGAGIPFKGTRRGDQIVLLRRDEFQFDEARWSVTEEMVGTLHGSAMQLTYAYAECDLGKTETCPGHCSIHARLALSPR